MTDRPLPDPGAELSHYVSSEPFDPKSIERLTAAQEKVYLASQWKLMWWKFKRHKVAVVCGLFLIPLYASILVSEIVAPYALTTKHSRFTYVPPQGIHLFHDGELVGPFVYGVKRSADPETLKPIYTRDESQVYPIRFFCSGDPYKFWGKLDWDTHLFCPPEEGRAPLFLLGTDKLGHDMFSRIVYGARISLTIGIVAITISFTLGIIIGGFAGYFGGVVDLVVQRFIEVLQSLPTIPLLLALAAVIPVTWSPIWVYFGITVILAMIDWTGLARAVRSKLLALREEDYVLAAQLMGGGYVTHHRPAYGARFCQPSDRERVALDPDDDP